MLQKDSIFSISWSVPFLNIWQASSHFCYTPQRLLTPIQNKNMILFWAIATILALRPLPGLRDQHSTHNQCLLSTTSATHLPLRQKFPIGAKNGAVKWSKVVDSNGLRDLVLNTLSVCAPHPMCLVQDGCEELSNAKLQKNSITWHDTFKQKALLCTGIEQNDSGCADLNKVFRASLSPLMFVFVSKKYFSLQRPDTSDFILPPLLLRVKSMWKCHETLKLMDSTLTTAW